MGSLGSWSNHVPEQDRSLGGKGNICIDVDADAIALQWFGYSAARSGVAAIASFLERKSWRCQAYDREGRRKGRYDTEPIATYGAESMERIVKTFQSDLQAFRDPDQAGVPDAT